MTNKTKLAMEVRKLEKQMDRCTVNHIWHFILSLLTGGLWLLVWAVLVDQNKRKIVELEQEMDEKIYHLDLLEGER